MFFTSFDVTKKDLWNPAADPLSPSPWTPCCQEATLFLSRPFLLAFRCGGKANKREGAGQPHAQSALIITYAGPSAAFFCFPKASLFFGSPSVLEPFAPFSFRTGQGMSPTSSVNCPLEHLYRRCPSTDASERPRTRS